MFSLSGVLHTVPLGVLPGVLFLKDVLYILVLGVLFGRAFSLSGVLHILAVGFLLRGAERFPEHRAVDLGPDIF